MLGNNITGTVLYGGVDGINGTNEGNEDGNVKGCDEGCDEGNVKGRNEGNVKGCVEGCDEGRDKGTCKCTDERSNVKVKYKIAVKIHCINNNIQQLKLDVFSCISGWIASCSKVKTFFE